MTTLGTRPARGLLAVLLAAPFLAQAVATIANVATPAIRTDQLAFTGRERVRAIGLFAIALSTGAVLGQIMGGELVSAHLAGTGWRPIFLVNVPICLGVAVAALRVLHTDEPTAGARLDVPGVLGLTATVLLVVVPLTHGRAEWWPLWTWLCLAATVPAFWLFLAGQRRRQAAGSAPLVDIDVVRRPPVLLGLLALLSGLGTYYALLFTLAQYVQQGLGRSALVSGLLFVPWVAAFGIAGQLIRRLPPRVAPTKQRHGPDARLGRPTVGGW